MDIFKSIIRFAYQPGQETVRAVSTNYSWNIIIGVLVATSVIDSFDPELYTQGTPFFQDFILNITLVPIMLCAATVVMALLTKWVFSLSRIPTTLKDNLLIGVWSGAVFTVVLLPITWLSIPFESEYEMLAIVYVLALGVVGYHALTRASYLHILGTFIATGFVVACAFVAVLVGLDVLGLVPMDTY